MRVRFTKLDAKKPILFHMWLELLALLVVLTLILSVFFGMARVSGNSMNPGLKNGEVVIYVRNVKSYERGDVVAVRLASGEMVIKRIAGLPGDELDLRDGILYVNGEPEQQDYVYGDTEEEVDTVRFPLTVEAGRYFILGDNREVSVDSRTYGSVGKSQILGRIIGT